MIHDYGTLDMSEKKKKNFFRESFVFDPTSESFENNL